MSPSRGRDQERAEAARSEEERERARLEREARRAARAAAAPPDPPPTQPPAPRPPIPIFDEEPPRAVTNVRPVGEPETGEHPEVPIGTRRVRVGSPLATAAGAGPPPRQHQRGIPPARRRHAGRRVAALAALAAALAVVWFLVSLVQPFHGAQGAAVTVRVPDGSSGSQIGDLLEQRGVVSSAFFFKLRARLAGKLSKLPSGVVRLRKDMTYGAAIDALTAKPAAAPTIKLTIPEGRSVRENASLVRQAGLKGDYVAAAGAHEGELFPATYQLRPGASVRTLVSDQLTAFRQNIAQVSLRRAHRKNLTRADVLIIASMIEREAQVPKDRRLISAVIYNRLKRRMPLGIDATIRYHLNNWSRPLRVSELQADSPYNTRTRLGLPPTPIGNPGLASIQAAANPAKVPYVYYVVAPCGDGAHAFSASDAQFQHDVAAYNAARAKRGGKDPSHC